MWHQLNWQRRKAWNWVCLQNTMFATRRHHTGPSLSSFTADFTPHKHQRFRLTLLKDSELAWSWYVLVTIANLNFLMHHPWTSHRFLSVLWTGWSQVSRILATLSLPKICIKVVCRCLYSNILHFDSTFSSLLASRLSESIIALCFSRTWNFVTFRATVQTKRFYIVWHLRKHHLHLISGHRLTRPGAAEIYSDYIIFFRGNFRTNLFLMTVTCSDMQRHAVTLIQVSEKDVLARGLTLRITLT